MQMISKNAEWIDSHQNIEDIARAAAGIDEIVIDPDAPEEYFTIDGMRLSSRPAVPGIYIMRKGAKTLKVIL